MTKDATLSKRNAKGKEQCVEDIESEEGGYHVEYTEVSEGLPTLVCNL